MTVQDARFLALRDGVYASCFAPQPAERRMIGVEVEFLAWYAGASRPVPLLGSRSALIPALRSYAPRAGWTEIPGYGEVPRFTTADGSLVSFEPGGQIEISTAAQTSVSEVLARLDTVVAPLQRGLADMGIELHSVGIDPVNDARVIPLQLPVERYERMTRHFERIGPYGIRMMRQTAAIQISVDRGEHPARRWRLLNDLAPYLIAIFANSPHYGGAETGHASYRAHCWRQLDPTRTGVAEFSDDPAATYTSFALGATEITDAGDTPQTFGRAGETRGRDADQRWATHLTTLFPEVRPRGHFEVRSCDAVDPAWYAAPIVLVAGLSYEPTAAAEAALLAAESRVLLRTAGERGLRDPDIARTARDLFQLGLQGAARLGTRYMDDHARETAAEFYNRYTALGRSPGDDRSIPVSAEQPVRATRNE